jgi:hypothetical protein
MKKFVSIALVLAATAYASYAQRAKGRPTPAAVPPKASVDKGTVGGRTYTNQTLRFEITFPDTWLIPGDDFEAEMRKQGIDLGLKAPASLAPSTRAKVNQALQKVTVLLTAYRSLPGMADNAIVRVSVEDLSSNPQIKDAVDYFDAIRASFAGMRLPIGFRYSETKAEKLGRQQFGFLDVTQGNEKKRMYATVRNGYAILFTLTYNKDEDLQTFRDVLAGGNFSLQ